MRSQKRRKLESGGGGAAVVKALNFGVDSSAKRYAHATQSTLHPALQFGVIIGENNRGVQSTLDLAQGTVLCSIRKVVDIEAEEFKELHDEVAQLGPQMRAAVLLFHIINTTSSGEYSARDYYAALHDYIAHGFPPTPPTNALLLSQEEKKLFKGTSIYPHMDDKEVSHVFDTFVRPLVKRKPDLFPDREQATVEKFKEAFSWVMSRAFRESGNESRCVLVPVADLFNHSCEHHAEMEYDDVTKQYIVRAIRSIKKQEEIFVTYGKLSNGLLMHAYGFVLPRTLRNPYDCVHIPHNSLCESAAAYVSAHLNINETLDKRKEVALQLLIQLSEGSASFGKYTVGVVNISAEDMYPEYVQQILQVFGMSDVAFAAWAKSDFHPGALQDDLCDTTIVDAIMLQIINDKLNTYITNDLKSELVTLQKLSKSSDTATVRKGVAECACEVRLVEKRILAELKLQLAEGADGGSDEEEQKG